MATPRKVTVKTIRDRRGFVRTTQRTPHELIEGMKFDYITITYRPHGYGYDMITVHAEGPREGWTEEPIVTVHWKTGGRDHKQEPDDFIATRAFARAFRDAMLQAEKLRRHMGVPTNSQQVEEWKR